MVSEKTLVMLMVAVVVPLVVVVVVAAAAVVVVVVVQNTNNGRGKRSSGISSNNSRSVGFYRTNRRLCLWPQLGLLYQLVTTVANRYGTLVERHRCGKKKPAEFSSIANLLSTNEIRYQNVSVISETNFLECVC
jgi:hypothetical protein